MKRTDFITNSGIDLTGVLMSTDSRYYDPEALDELTLAINIDAINLERRSVLKALYQLTPEEVRHSLRIHHASREETNYCIQLLKTYYPSAVVRIGGGIPKNGLYITTAQIPDLILIDICSQEYVVEVEYGNCTIDKALEPRVGELWVIPSVYLGKLEFYIFKSGKKWERFQRAKLELLRENHNRLSLYMK